MSEELGLRREPTPEEFERMQQSPEFQELRRRFRRFAFPMTVLFIVWFFVYVLLSTYAVDLMSTPVFGLVNVGLLLGVGQFVSTALITVAYVRYMNKRVDPSARTIRHELEGGEYA